MTCSRIHQFFCLVLSFVFLAVAANAQDVTPLEVGKTISRTAKRQQVDTYSLTLTAGQFIHVTVEQNEVDVSVDLVTPDGKPAHTVNASRFFGKESLSWEATESGNYKLIIRLVSPREGTYQVQLEVKASATAQDKQRIAAERLVTDIARPMPPEQRSEKYQQALRSWRELDDRQAEAHTHEAMGAAYQAERKYAQAREHYNLALPLKQELQDHLGRIITLYNIGLSARVERNTSADRNSERSQQLIKQDEELHFQALALSREFKHRGAERFILNSLTGTYRSQNLPEKVIAMLEQVLVIDRESKNRTSEADTLRFLGQAFGEAKQNEQARRRFEESLAIFREIKDRTGEANAIYSIGIVQEQARQFEVALQKYEAALVLFREVKDRRGEANALRSIGLLHVHNSREAAAVKFLDEAIVIYRELKDRVILSSLLGTAALANGRLGHYENTQRYFDENLSLSREAKDRPGEAATLERIGYANFLLSRYEKALEYYALALPIYLELKNRTGEATVYREISNARNSMGQYEVGIEYQEKALAIWREIRNETQQGGALSNLGAAYRALNRNEKAIEYLEEALGIARRTKNRLLERNVLVNLGDAYHYSELYLKSQEYYEQALSFARVTRDQRGEAYALWGFGLNFHKLGQLQKAAECYEQSLGIFQKVKSRSDEGEVRADYAMTLRALGQIEKAIHHDLLALYLAREIKSRNAEAAALNGLLLDWKSQQQPQLAIFFGKQAVNTYQDIRSGLRSLDQQSQQSFLKSKEQTYRELADLLISQGRLPEAEQVIRMLKEEEYFEYVRRDQNNSPKGERAALTPEEAAIDKRYREIADKLSEIGAQRSELLSKPVRTAEEEQLLAKLEGDLIVANQMFQKFLDGLATEMAKQKDGGAALTKLRDAQGLMEDLRELGKGTVALYTLVGENTYRVILTTADFQRAYEYPIKAADLNRKILAFRNVLQDPSLDPLPPAQELYKILIAPLVKDLKATKAETLMWSLDGVLRYVPIAALHDGEKYLVERWRNVVFTPASNARLKDAVSRNWKALGLGVTKSFGEKMPALPSVAEEMRGIINDGNSTKGVLPGTIKLDEQFTQDTMLAGLRQRPPVVHVASHFQFKPGNETDSALLLGDGKFLSLAQIKAYPNVFGGVELLTLSACDTATGGSGATGKEVEGFAVQAQRQGAKAVVASLWPVADRTTRLLMEAFYRGREEQRLSKGEALRQAQIKLLRGDLTRKSAADALATRGSQEPVKTGTARAEIKRPYAHPYYWAPFIMIGNWK